MFRDQFSKECNNTNRDKGIQGELLSDLPESKPDRRKIKQHIQTAIGKLDPLEFAENILDQNRRS